MWNTFCHKVINQLQRCVLNTKKHDPGKAFLENNYAPVHEEVRVENLPVRGQLPHFLHGTYIRNGPNPIRHLPKSYHWFDGDGMVHGTFLDPTSNRAHYQNLQIQTPRLWDIQNHVTIGSMTGIQGLVFLLLDRLRPLQKPSSTANTSVVYFGGRVLAMNEEDVPYELRLGPKGELENVGRMGEFTIASVTAHPKIDPSSNEMYFIKYDMFDPHVLVGCCDENFHTIWQQEVELPHSVMMHDFGITENYVLLLDNPLTFDPHRMIDGENSPISFDPSLSSRIGVLPKKAPIDMTRWFDMPVAYGCFHVVHSYEQDDRIYVYLCQYESIDILFAQTHRALPQVVEHVIDLKTGKTYSAPIPMTEGSEFPTGNPELLGRKSKYSWVALVRASGMPSHFYGIAKLDLQEGYVVRRLEYPVHCYGGEPLFVPHPDGESDDDGVLIVYTHNERQRLSQLRVYDAKTMNYEPIAIVDMPQRIPYGLHGCFIPKN